MKRREGESGCLSLSLTLLEGVLECNNVLVVVKGGRGGV